MASVGPARPFVRSGSREAMIMCCYTPGRLDVDVLVDGEQGAEPLVLPIGEQVGAGVQSPPGGVAGVGV